MAQPKQVWLATDGTEFNTEHEADAHSMRLSTQNHVEAYIQAFGITKAQAGLFRKHLPAYLAFREANPDASAEVAAKPKGPGRGRKKAEAAEGAAAE